MADPLFPESEPLGSDDLSEQYRSLMDSDGARKKTALSLSAQAARQTTPEATAKIRDLSRHTGIPESIVDVDIAAVEESVLAQQYRGLLNTDPKLAEWLANPDNSKIARGDEENLGRLGQTLKYMGGDASRKLSKLGGDISELGSAYSRSEQQTAQMEAGFDRLMGKGMSGEDFGDSKPSGYRFPNTAAPDIVAPKPLPPTAKPTAFDVEGSYLPGWTYTIAENLSPTVEVFKSGATGALVTGGAGALAVGGGVGLLTGGAAAIPAAIGGFTTAAPAGFTAGAFLKSFQLEAGGAYQEFSQITAESGETLDPDIARGAAVLAGSINAGLEVFSLKYIVDKIPGLKVLVSKGGKEVAKQAMATPTARSLLARLGKTVALTTSVGGLTETAQEIVPIILGELSKWLDTDIKAVGEGSAEDYGDSKPSGLIGNIPAPGETDKEFKSPGMFEDQYDKDGNVVGKAFVPRVVHSAQIGALLGGFFGGIGGGVQAGIDFRAMGKPARDAEKKAKADALREKLDEAGKQVDATKLSKLDRDALRDIIKRQAEGGRENIFFQSKDWDDAFTKAGIDPEVAYQTVMGDIADYREAKTLDGLLTIPIERFLADIPTEIRTALSKKALDSEDGLTASEGEQIDAKIEEANKTALAAFEEYKDAKADTAREFIANDIVGQLLGTYSRDVSEEYAKVQAEKFVAFAERNGLDPEAYYKERAPEVKASIAATIRAQVDTQLDPLIDALAKNEIPTAKEAYGETLTEWLRRKGGIREDGGELAARDAVEYDKDTRKPGENSLVTEDGLTLDEAARMAMDEGFLTGTFENMEETPDRLLEALEDEMRGTPVYSPQNENRHLSGRREQLLTLDDILNRAGIDLKTANRQEVKDLIRGQMLEQPVFHGTPHIWPPEPGFPHGRPRLDHIGTGEGAAVFGWGWYSAENQAVAKAYAVALANERRGPLSRAVSGFGREVKDLQALKDILSGDAPWPMNHKGSPVSRDFVLREIEDRKDSVKTLESLKARLLNLEQTYTLDIPEDVLPNLLDWDAGMSEQTPEVRKALEAIPPWRDNGSFIDNTDAKVPGEAIYAVIAGRLGGKKAASEYLASIGIVGNRYLDAVSRGYQVVLKQNGKEYARNKFDNRSTADAYAKEKRSEGFSAEVVQEGTSNYVIWDQPTLDRVALLERNGEKLDAMRDDAARSMEQSALPETITIDGVERPTTNSEGQQIHPTEAGIRNFWKWFSGSAAVDDQGRPQVYYRGDSSEVSAFDGDKRREYGVFTTTEKEVARVYAGKIEPKAVYIKAEKILDLSDDGRKARAWVKKWAKSFDEWIDRETGEEVDPFDALAQGRMFDFEGDWSGERWNDIQRSAEADGYDAVILPDHDSAHGVFNSTVVFDGANLKSATGNTGAFSPSSPKIFEQSSIPASEWYSQLRSVLDKKLPNSGTAESMLKMIDSYTDFKADELKYSGLREWLTKQSGKVTKQQILDELDLNAVKVETVTLGSSNPYNYTGDEWQEAIYRAEAVGDFDEAERIGRAWEGVDEETGSTAGTPKFAEWQLKGDKTNYREVLLKLPSESRIDEQWRIFDANGISRGTFATEESAKRYAKSLGEGFSYKRVEDQAYDTGFPSPHFGGRLNPVAHLRMNDRIDAEGNKHLFVEEVQSEFSLELRKRAEEKAKQEGLKKDTPEFKARAKELVKDPVALGLPDLPLASVYTELAMKKALRLAVEGGYDSLSWITGEQTQDRYDLSKSISRIEYVPDLDQGDTYEVMAYDLDGNRVFREDEIPLSRVEELVGKDVAEKIASGEGERSANEPFPDLHTLSGIDLKIGGEWAISLYDRQLVNELNKYVKKWGGRVGESTINGETQHSLKITPEIRKGVSAGQSLFQDRPNARASIQFPEFPGDRFIIDLSNADFSSFEHEMAHFWLEEISRVAKMEGANPNTVKDHGKILEWFGQNAGEILDVMKDTAKNPKQKLITPEIVAEVERRGGVAYIQQRAALGATSLTGDATEIAVARSLHEYWARGAEAYLYEGKAPSLDLREAFARFYGWMRQVYSNIKQLRVTLSDDIRGVMDRLQATDEQIAAASGRQSHRALFDKPEEYGTPEEWAAYQKQVERAKEQARSDVTVQMLAPLKRAQESWYRTRREEIRAKIEAEVKSRQDYKAQRYLRTGLHESIDKPMKMSKASLKRSYPEAYLLRLKGMYYATKGVDYGVLAGMLGYKSGNDLVLDLVNAPQNQKAWDKIIDTETDALLVEQYGDPMTDGTLAAKTMTAVHNDGRAAQLVLEARKLATKAGKPPDETPYQIIKRAARSAIERQVNRDINPNKYRVAEAKAGKKAFEAAALGKFDEALIAKQQELWAHEMFRAAEAAKETLADIQNKLKDLTKKAAQDRFAKSGKEYLQAVNFLLGSYGFGPRRLDENGDLRAFLEELSKKGEAVEITEEMLARVASGNVVSLKDITYAEALDIQDALKNLGVLARRELMAETGRKKIEWADAIGQLTGRILQTQKPGKPLLASSDRRGWDKAKHVYRGFADIVENAQSIVEILDGGKEGPWHDQFWNVAADARDNQNELSERVLKPITEIIDQGGRALAARMLEPIPLKTLGLETTRSTLIAVALNLGTNAKKLMLGGTVINGNHVEFSQTVIDEVKSKLAREDWDLVVAIWDAAGKLYQPTRELQERLGLRMPDRLIGDVISTPFGDIQGKYFPLFADSEKSAVGQNMEARQSAQAIAGNIARPMTSKSRTKERTGAMYPLNLNLNNVLFKAMGDAIADVSQREFLLHANRILNNSSVMSLIRERAGDTHYASLKAMVNRAVNEREAYDPAMVYPNKLQEAIVLNLSTMALGYRFALGVANWMTGLAQALPNVRLDYLAGGMWRHHKAPNEATEFIESLSPYMKHRKGHMDYAFIEALKKLAGKQSLRSKIARASMAYIVTADHLVSKPLWLGVFHQAMDGYARAGGTGYLPSAEEKEQAIRLADKAVQTTQNDPTAIGISAFEASPRFRLFKLFIGPMLIQQTKFRNAAVGKGASYDTSWPERFGVILATWIVPCMMFDIIMGRWPDIDDDDDLEEKAEKWATWAAVKIGLYPAMTYPWVRDLANIAERKLLDKPAFGRSNPIHEAGATIIDNLMGVGDEALDVFDEEEEIDIVKFLDHAGKVAGAFGYPYLAGKTAGGFVYDVGTGEYEPSSPADLRYLFIKRPEEK